MATDTVRMHLIPVEMGYLGWQESLEQLAKRVEPGIPG